MTLYNNIKKYKIKTNSFGGIINPFLLKNIKKFDFLNETIVLIVIN
jgi:hypothetical protein